MASLPHDPRNADSPHCERLTRWVAEHGPALQAFLGARLRDRHTADDLVQEVFCRAWRGRLRYQDQGLERAYLMQIADRLACDWSRRAKPEIAVDASTWDGLQLHAPGPADDAAQAEAAAVLRQALGDLSDAQQRTLLLRYYGGLEFGQIAELLGCSVNTALSHGRRALLALRKRLVDKLP